MQQSLANLSTYSQQLELKREGAYQAVLAEVQNIQRSHTDLRKETTKLVAALRAPKVRGNWGEMQLRKCVEFAGMVEHASFEVERYVKGEDGAIRPDLIVSLPNGRSIIVDAKTPLDAFLDASGCEDEVLRSGYLKAHAAQVRKHLDSLCGKAYWKQFPESPDFVVCFLPSEVLFSAALEQDPSLLEYSVRSKVLLVTPTTLIALLKAVAYGWEQSKIARDAELIRDEALKVQSKLAGMYDAIADLGAKLRRAGEAYDDMVARAEGQGGLFSIARRLRDLKIGERDLPVAKIAAMQLRPLSSDDWQGQLTLAAVAEPEDQVRDEVVAEPHA
jgi:DNA recombination protein RmuC